MYKRNNYEQPVFHIWAKQIYIYILLCLGGGGVIMYINKFILFTFS